jgi:DNA-binding NtrC family response regulator
MKKDKINLMVVDDEEDFLKSITGRLEARDFSVTPVNRGEKAIEAAREKEIDVALVDLKMPGMDGEKTLQALKKEHGHMEIVILTGHGTIDSAAECTRMGAYSYLQKPCKLDELLEALKNAYKKKVMSKKKIDEEKMNEMLQMSLTTSARDILRKIKEIDREEKAPA